MEVAERHNILVPGDTLGCYRIDGLLGKGGFGLTYLAFDTSLEMSVAIKEYMPEQFASRASDGSVRPRSPGQLDIFSWGLTRFISEARTLAKFRHPNIVRVISVFERNRTAYMVMEHERGAELKHLLDRPDFRTEVNLKRIVGPVLDGLSEVHRHDYIHRDIKPANILIREDGTPVLLDFGSARLATGAQTQALTSLVSGGYAPLEQYSEAESKEQGPWTDIYALGAVLYFSVTGDAPSESTLRGWAMLKNRPDPLVALRQLSPEGYSPAFCEAIDWALRLEATDRPQSVDVWRQHLLPNDETVHIAPASRDSLPPDTTAELPATVARRARIGDRASQRPPPRRSIEATVAATADEGDVAGRSGGQDTHGMAVAAGNSWSRRKVTGGVVLTLLLMATAGVLTRERWLPGAIEFASSVRPPSDASLADSPEIPSPSYTPPTGREVTPSGDRQAAEQERESAAARQAEATRQAEAERQAEEERQIEIERREAAAARQAEEERQAAAAQQAEEEQEAAAAQQAERERREAAAARQAEEERQAAAAQQAERERQEAAARQAEKARQAATAREAEKARQAATARQAEKVRQEAAARQAESERREAAAARQVDPTRRISETDLNVVTGRFNALKRAIQQKDKTAMRQLTASSARKYAYFDYLFDNYETIDVSVSGVQASRRDQTVRAVLELDRMVRRNGNIALPPSEFQEIPLHSTRRDQWSDIQW